MKKHVALYIRVSTQEQNHDLQVADLKYQCQRYSDRGYEIVQYDDKFTGTTMDRPGWNRLSEAMKHGLVDTILVWRIDRLGRTASGLTALFEELNRTGVNLISEKDGVDLSTPAGRLMANLLASVAQYETEVRQERQLAGIAAAKEAGKTWGGSKGGRISKRTQQLGAKVRRMARNGSSVVRIREVTGLARKTIVKIIAKMKADEEAGVRQEVDA